MKFPLCSCGIINTSEKNDEGGTVLMLTAIFMSAMLFLFVLSVDSHFMLQSRLEGQNVGEYFAIAALAGYKKANVTTGGDEFGTRRESAISFLQSMENINQIFGLTSGDLDFSVYECSQNICTGNDWEIIFGRWTQIGNTGQFSGATIIGGGGGGRGGAGEEGNHMSGNGGGTGGMGDSLAGNGGSTSGKGGDIEVGVEVEGNSFIGKGDSLGGGKDSLGGKRDSGNGGRESLASRDFYDVGGSFGADNGFETNDGLGVGGNPGGYEFGTDDGGVEVGGAEGSVDPASVNAVKFRMEIGQDKVITFFTVLDGSNKTPTSSIAFLEPDSSRIIRIAKIIAGGHAH